MEISVMKTMLSAASVLVIAAGASAAQFQFVSYEAGGGIAGISGAGFSTSGSFFNSNAGFTIGSPNIASLATDQEFDSYFTIDTLGGSGLTGAGQDTANFYGDYPGFGWNGSDGTDFNTSPATAPAFTLTGGPGSAIAGSAAGAGLAATPAPFLSGFAPNTGGGRSTLDGVMIARLTVTSGASLSGGALVTIQDSLVAGGTAFSGNVSLGGAPVIIGAQAYQLVAYLVTTRANVITGGPPFGASFGAADVYDVFFQTIPSPGAMALLGMGGLVTLRRRRS